MSAVPLEIFGYRATSKEALGAFQGGVDKKSCPFTGLACDKRRKDDEGTLLGSCSVQVGTGSTKNLIICPHRFKEDNIIFKEVGKLLLDGDLYNSYPEVKFDAGSVDFLLTSQKDGEVVDFAGIEIQGLDTTGSLYGHLQKALGLKSLPGGFGINWRMSAKTILSQVQHKLPEYERMQKKQVLVIQEDFLEYIEKEFDASSLRPAVATDSFHIHTYALEEKDGKMSLVLKRKVSTDSKGVSKLQGFGRTGKRTAEELTKHLLSSKTPTLRLSNLPA